MRQNLSILVAALVLASGCHSYSTVHMEENADPATSPSVIRVKLKDRSEVTVYSPVVRGDSLHGYFDKSESREAHFALREVDQASVSRVSGGKTAALTAGIVTGLLVLFLILAAATTTVIVD